MTYSVQTSHAADAYFGRLDRPTQERIAARLADLSANPLDPQHSKPLRSVGGERSSRVGGYRIIFRVDSEHQIIAVDAIAPRGRAYRELR